MPRVTHPSATVPKSKLLVLVRLACVKPAASVRSEPESNSQVESVSDCHITGVSIHKCIEALVAFQRNHECLIVSK